MIIAGRSSVFGILVIATSLTIGCSSPHQTTILPLPDASAAADMSSSDPCAPGQVVMLRYFVASLGVCSSTYQEALAKGLACPEQTGECTGYHVVGAPGPFIAWDCFYDVNTGQLAGADYSNDERPFCAAGIQSATCGFTGYTSGDHCEADGGTS